MVDFEQTLTFLIVEDLFERYVILVNTFNESTSVYCQVCDEWVARWDGDQLSKYSTTQLQERIMDEHEKQVFGHEVRFDSTESFI